MRRNILLTLGIVALGCPLNAQEFPPSWLTKLLPSDATVVQTADFPTTRPRAVVLWMINPEFHDRLNKEGGDCSDIATGDFGKYWKGPTRLSLLDTRNYKILSTIDVEDGCDTCSDSFQVPLCLRSSPADSRGRPNIILQDLTGGGLKVDFTLLSFQAFESVSTAVFGYEPKLDRLVQYPVENQGVRTLWVDDVFARPPLSPGHWKFLWKPGHGDDSTYSQDVSFDPAKRTFIQKLQKVDR